ncbi:hypothetical protein ACFXAF_22230 [Kitasatospora sp. NPDC059463]|uniref:hypothetical protein n=1 Tax=unclassified Kitasatospora TaxID=2633591 RepID=UPI0036796E61
MTAAWNLAVGPSTEPTPTTDPTAGGPTVTDPPVTDPPVTDPLAADLQLRDGDLAAVTGPDALLQSVRLALTTALGTDPLDRGFGFDGLRVLAEERTPELVRERIRVAVLAVLRRDPRVRRVLDVRVDDPSGADRALVVGAVLETDTGAVLPVTLTTGVQRA